MSDLHPSLKPIRYQKTFCIIKPDAVKRGLTGDIINRIEKAGLKIVAMKMIVADKDLIEKHYPMSDEAWVHRLGEKSLSGFDNIDVDPKEVLGSDDKAVIGKGVSDALVGYMTSGPMICFVVEGVSAIDMVRKLAGHTLPFKADVGTIRGDYSVDSPSIANAEKRSVHNLFHASENAGEAENEIKLWFGNEPIYDYQRSSEDVMYKKHY